MLQRALGTTPIPVCRLPLLRDSTPLNDHGRGGTTTVADASDTDLALLQLMCEGDDDSASTRTDRVTERDGTALGVDLCRVNVHDFFGGTDDDGECFVEFEQGDVFLRNTGGLEGLGDGECGCGGEVDRGGGGIGEACRNALAEGSLREIFCTYPKFGQAA